MRFFLTARNGRLVLIFAAGGRLVWAGGMASVICCAWGGFVVCWTGIDKVCIAPSNGVWTGAASINGIRTGITPLTPGKGTDDSGAAT